VYHEFCNHSHGNMAVWWLFSLFMFHLSCMSPSCAHPGGLSKAFSYSLKSTRCTHARVKQLLRRYKEEQLDDVQFEDRNLELKTLPSLSTDFNQWLQMKDWERLSTASHDLHTFWAHLDRKRREMEEEGDRASQGMSNRRKAKLSIPESIQCIQKDLRDLMTKVNFQLKSMNSSSVSPTSPNTMTWQVGLSTSSWAKSTSLWASRLEGYIILRDLESYLSKLTRDFTLLRTRHSLPPGTPHRGR
uniref:Ciliary neurotrophic factor n=1 Tax=Esox lucius TaxID=8010 RepID=A0A6Q2ZCW7_ESOLU